MEKIRVGTIGLSYNHRKNFFGLDPIRIEYLKVYDLISPYRFILRIGLIKKAIGHPLMRNIHFAPFQWKVDVLHFFNTVSLSNTPWLTTFETFLPRWGMDEFGLQRICSRSCLGIVSMSECSKNIMLKKVQDNFPKYFEEISSKTFLIHPSQRPLINSWEEKEIDLEGKLTFTMVGNDFFRKGGREILKVFTELIEDKVNIELRIISNLSFGDYASCSTNEDREWAIKTIEKHPNQIKYFQNIPNNQVLELLKSSHVGLLPTYADTYGYSVLEMQAMGCPVITTNVRALPEINNKGKGWVIEVPKDEYGEGKFKTDEERKILFEKIKAGLREAILEIILNPSLIQERGDLALKELEILNCPKKNGDAYFQLYRKGSNSN